mmetsp:Transcript_8961/g.26912  ORF Transcript_8961/g.26912 Transcript_8961/m.26912 type:complete len:789 (-) Transcript_8961:36-2402(-)
MGVFSACLGKAHEHGSHDGSESSSEMSVANKNEAEHGVEPVPELRSPELMEGLVTEPRGAFKSRLRRTVVAVEKRRKETHKDFSSVQEQQFFVLAKIFSEENAFDELKRLAEKHPKATLQVLPFILNSLLYGSMETRKSLEEVKRSAARLSFTNSKKKKESEKTLNVVTKMAPVEYERQLEQIIFELCRKSVHAALHCAWYFISSLNLGPKSSYHRTMRLLLSMESVVMVNKAVNDDLMSKVELNVKAKEGVDNRKRTQVLGKSEVQPWNASAQQVSADGDGIAPAPLIPNTGLLIKLDTFGDGFGDVSVTMPYTKPDDKEALSEWLDARRERSNFFHAELDYVKCLTDLSYDLFTVPRAQRKSALRAELEKLNQFVPKRAFVPVAGFPHRILSIVPSEAFVFSTKERSPYLITFEVELLDRGTTDDDPVSNKKFLKRKPKASEEIADDDTHGPEETFTYVPNIESMGDVKEEQTQPDPADDDSHDSMGEDVDPQIVEAFGEPWSEKEARIRQTSSHGHLTNWALASCIVKSRDQLRQEMFAMRLILEFVHIFKNANLGLWIKPYQILATSADSGFIETIKNSKSMSSLRSDPKFTTLPAFFRTKFGGEKSARYKRAVNNFVRSMAGYSVVCYILAIKDRHNGNLMLDAEGHLCHIDFGFLLSNSPGGNREFERAPFKLTQEMIDTMGGKNSLYFRRFRKLCRKGYAEACKHVNKILLEVDMMYNGNEIMPCFVMGRRAVLDGLRERMMASASPSERMRKFDELINLSMNNWTTKWYDRYQKCFTGIN